MKYTYFFFIILVQNFSFAQDSRLFENNWYLTNLIINGSDNLPPLNSITVVFDQQSSIIGAGGTNCNALVGDGIYIQNNTTDFTFTNFNATLLVCPEIYFYENLYFNFFTENTNTNNFTYSISEIENVKTLRINSMFNKQAVYSSQMLSNKEYNAFDFSIYPNPASEFIDVSINNQSLKNAQIKVYNTLGKLCKTTIINSNEERIDLQNLASGIYLIKLETSEGIITKKINKL